MVREAGQRDLDAILDYDDSEDLEELIDFIMTGKKNKDGKIGGSYN